MCPGSVDREYPKVTRDLWSTNVHHMINSYIRSCHDHIAMNHATLVVNLLAVWLILQTSAMMIADKWDVEELTKRLHDPAKERIDLACDACDVMVDAIQSLARSGVSEDVIVAVLKKLCVILKIEDSLVCNGIIPEFKVSACCYVKHQHDTSMVFVAIE